MLAMLLVSVSVMSLFAVPAFAGQEDGYHDPAERWMNASNRTNELDVNATVTHETFIEEDDAFWNTFKYKGKKNPIPDWNERKYQRKGDYYARSMSQILYEETGCIMPRNLHIYDRRSKALSKYGVDDKEAVYLLSIMTAMAYARRQRVAQNLDEEFDSDYSAEEPGKATEDDNAAAYREEIKRLRSALHDAEKAARDARKALDESREQSLIEHRELADLRELVFHQDENDLGDEDEPAKDESVFPYTVQRNTLVFGGHDTWIKTIKKLLGGNIRFVSKDYGHLFTEVQKTIADDLNSMRR